MLPSKRLREMTAISFGESNERPLRRSNEMTTGVGGLYRVPSDRTHGKLSMTSGHWVIFNRVYYVWVELEVRGMGAGAGGMCM